MRRLRQEAWTARLGIVAKVLVLLVAAQLWSHALHHWLKLSKGRQAARDFHSAVLAFSQILHLIHHLQRKVGEIVNLFKKCKKIDRSQKTDDNSRIMLK